MATWEISTVYKKSSIERQYWYKDNKVIIREEGYRWGTFTVESDTMPVTMEELVNEDNDYELGYVDDDNSWELVDLIDGCWSDTEKGRNCTDEDLEEFENAWEEDYFEGVEELGWSLDETEYYMTGPLKLTNKDTGVEYSGLTDPTTIVHTMELPGQTTESKQPAVLNPNAAWPFSRPEEGTTEYAKFKCTNCEFETEDIMDLVDNPNDDDNGAYLCPECNSKVDLG